MIIYWKTLEKDANDISTIPDYIASVYAPEVKRSLNSAYLRNYPANPYPSANSIPVLNANGLLPDQLLLKSKLVLAYRNLSSSSGDVSYTGAGFKPSSVIILFGVDQQANGIMGCGFCDSSLSCANVSKNTSNGVHIWDRIVGGVVDISNYQGAIVKSFDDDGITLTWTKVGSPTSNMTMFILFLK